MGEFVADFVIAVLGALGDAIENLDDGSEAAEGVVVKRGRLCQRVEGLYAAVGTVVDVRIP